MLLIILLSAIVVLCDRSLFYMPILTTAFFMIYYVLTNWTSVVDYACGLRQLSASGVGQTSQAMYDRYIEPLHKVDINDNRFITTATNVSPGSRIRQSDNIRDMSSMGQPIVVTPDVDTESTRHLNIDRNIGGFRIDGADQYASSLNAMRQEKNASFYSDTNVQRDYMLSNANDKVAFKNQSERIMPSHKWFKL